MHLKAPELERILNRVHEWTRAADQKAYVLVLIQTGVPTVLAGTLKEWYTRPELMPYRFPVLLATVGWLGSLVCSALVLLTRTKWKGGQSFTFFATIEKWTLDGYRKHLSKLTEEEIRDDYIDQIWVSSRICSLKHFFLKIANYSFLTSAAGIMGCYVYRALTE